jgi:hypothetical protein
MLLPRNSRKNLFFQMIELDPPPEVCRLPSRNVEILRYMEDVQLYFDRVRVLVVLLRFRAGVKGKVNQSKALGVPTVFSSTAAGGMYLVHGHNVMIADNPWSFADAVVRVYTSAGLWERISVIGRESVGEHIAIEAADREPTNCWNGQGSRASREVAGDTTNSRAKTAQSTMSTTSSSESLDATSETS